MRYKDCVIVTELEVTPGAVWCVNGLLLTRVLAWDRHANAAAIHVLRRTGVSQQNRSQGQYGEQPLCLCLPAPSIH